MSSFSTLKSDEFCKAARLGNLPLVQTLSLDPEVDLNYLGSNDWTPFQFACYYNHVDIVRYLLDFTDKQPLNPRTIDYNLEDDCLSTPLFYACSNKVEKIVEMLLSDERIDVNKADEDGWTPLHIASRRGHVGVVGLLLLFGREIETGLGDLDNGETPAERARNRKFEGIAQLIEGFQREPERVRRGLRWEFESSRRMKRAFLSSSFIPFVLSSSFFLQVYAGELFALVVYLCDGYFEIQQSSEKMKIDPQEDEEEGKERLKRFFSLAIQLPMDLQMVLCNRVFDLGASTIKGSHSEEGFKKFARDFDQLQKQ